MSEERTYTIDEYGFDDEGKLKRKSRTRTNDLKGWFDREIGYEVLDEPY